jgi:hypothetical protein
VNPTLRRSVRSVVAFVATLVLLPCQLLPCQQPADGQDPAGKDKPPAKQEPTKAAEWPALDKTRQDRVHALVGQFRKPDEQLHADASKQLVELGAGAAPILMRLVSDRAENQNEPIFAVLDRIVTAEHSALLTREIKNPRSELRRYVLRRLCQLAEEALRPTFEAAMADKDEQVAFYGALGALSLRDKKGLPKVMAMARSNWSDVAPLVAAVLPAARSAECGTWVFEQITNAGPVDKMTGLRLLRYLMVMDQKVILRSYLDAPDHAVKREAINTARVLHGEAPIENLPVFQAIEMAQEWLKKL